ncbi:DUF397 domain-containing protein [Actinoallomurus rhizosphaericola]
MIRASLNWRKSSQSGQEGTDCVEVVRLRGAAAADPEADRA